MRQACGRLVLSGAASLFVRVARQSFYVVHSLLHLLTFDARTDNQQKCAVVEGIIAGSGSTIDRLLDTLDAGSCIVAVGVFVSVNLLVSTQSHNN